MVDCGNLKVRVKNCPVTDGRVAGWDVEVRNSPVLSHVAPYPRPRPPQRIRNRSVPFHGRTQNCRMSSREPGYRRDTDH